MIIWAPILTWTIFSILSIGIIKFKYKEVDVGDLILSIVSGPIMFLMLIAFILMDSGIMNKRIL